jgi:hypothetical protein
VWYAVKEAPRCGLTSTSLRLYDTEASRIACAGALCQRCLQAVVPTTNFSCSSECTANACEHFDNFRSSTSNCVLFAQARQFEFEVMSDARDSMPQWKGLFDWSMSYQDGTKPTEFGERGPPDPQKLKWYRPHTSILGSRPPRSTCKRKDTIIGAVVGWSMFSRTIWWTSPNVWRR